MNRYGQHCYTYVIGWRNLDVWYYGSRWANKVKPEEDLWSHYFTSSSHVKNFILENGQPDTIKICRKFDSVGEVRRHENKFITRYKCVKSKRWLNKGVPNGRFSHTKKHSEETKRKIGAKTTERWSDPEYRQRETDKIKARMPPSKETRKVLSKSMRKVYLDSIERWNCCPHCQKIGSGLGMRRWHFDNCKVK